MNQIFTILGFIVAFLLLVSGVSFAFFLTKPFLRHHPGDLSDFDKYMLTGNIDNIRAYFLPALISLILIIVFGLLLFETSLKNYL